MNNRISIALILTIFFVFAVSGCKKTQEDTQSKFFKHNASAVSLFNGNNFEGWLADTNYFKIVDSEIVAGTLDAPIDTMIWMTTEERYDHFILDLDVKLMGGDNEEAANAGILKSLILSVTRTA